MQYFLVEFDCSWANEFNMYGWNIMTSEELANEIAFLCKHGENEAPFVRFGTNEEFSEHTYNDWWSSFNVVKEVSKDTYLDLKSVLAPKYKGDSTGQGLFVLPTELSKQDDLDSEMW